MFIHSNQRGFFCILKASSSFVTTNSYTIRSINIFFITFFPYMLNRMTYWLRKCHFRISFWLAEWETSVYPFLERSTTAVFNRLNVLFNFILSYEVLFWLGQLVMFYLILCSTYPNEAYKLNVFIINYYC